MVICLERDADLYMAQLMPLPLTVSCFSKIQIGFTFLVLAHLGSPGQRAVKWLCVCVCVCTIYCVYYKEHCLTFCRTCTFCCLRRLSTVLWCCWLSIKVLVWLSVWSNMQIVCIWSVCDTVFQIQNGPRVTCLRAATNNWFWAILKRWIFYSDIKSHCL